MNDSKFDEALEEIVDETIVHGGVSSIMSIPGVHEALSNHFNNEALARVKEKEEAEAERNDPDFMHEPDCPEEGPCKCPLDSGPSYRDGSPGYDHAAGYHD